MTADGTASHERERALVSVHVLVLGEQVRLKNALDALYAEGATLTVAKPIVVSDVCADAWPDVALVDVTADTRREALEALGWLRRQANIPALVVTELADVDARLRALRIGADDCVSPAAPREV